MKRLYERISKRLKGNLKNKGLKTFF